MVIVVLVFAMWACLLVIVSTNDLTKLSGAWHEIHYSNIFQFLIRKLYCWEIQLLYVQKSLNSYFIRILLSYSQMLIFGGDTYLSWYLSTPRFERDTLDFSAKRYQATDCGDYWVELSSRISVRRWFGFWFRIYRTLSRAALLTRYSLKWLIIFGWLFISLSFYLRL